MTKPLFFTCGYFSGDCSTLILISRPPDCRQPRYGEAERLEIHKGNDELNLHSGPAQTTRPSFAKRLMRAAYYSDSDYNSGTASLKPCPDAISHQNLTLCCCLARARRASLRSPGSLPSKTLWIFLPGEFSRAPRSLRNLLASARSYSRFTILPFSQSGYSLACYRGNEYTYMLNHSLDWLVGTFVFNGHLRGSLYFFSIASRSSLSLWAACHSESV